MFPEQNLFIAGTKVQKGFGGGGWLGFLFSGVEEEPSTTVSGKIRGVIRWKERAMEGFPHLQTIHKKLIQVELLGCQECGGTPQACDLGDWPDSPCHYTPRAHEPPLSDIFHFPGTGLHVMRSNAKNIRKQETLTANMKESNTTPHLSSFVMSLLPLIESRIMARLCNDENKPTECSLPEKVPRRSGK